MTKEFRRDNKRITLWC